MNLTEKPEFIEWPETHYVFVEATGPFQQNAQKAWQTAHSLVPALGERNKIKGYMSLYKVGPQLYRAGFALADVPVDLPEGFHYEKFSGGKYARYVLTGSYAQLPQACGRAFAMVAEQKLQVRDGFNIENYVNDPRTTPEAELITELLFPVD